LRDDIAGNTLSGDYQTLVDDYARRVVLWWTMVEALPSLTYKVDNGTLVQRTSEDSSPVSDVVFKDMLNRARANAEYYTALMVDYLCANSSEFPEYSDNVYPQRPPLQMRKGSGSYIFSRGNTATSHDVYDYRLSQLPR
jgi:hypothetical protein